VATSIQRRDQPFEEGCILQPAAVNGLKKIAHDGASGLFIG
jgi:hypothetical protein